LSARILAVGAILPAHFAAQPTLQLRIFPIADFGFWVADSTKLGGSLYARRPTDWYQENQPDDSSFNPESKIRNPQ